MDNYERNTKISSENRVQASSLQSGYPDKPGLDPEILDLVGLRLAQLRDCAVGIASHTASLRKRGEREERLKELSNWSSSGLFNRHERFALALAENLTSNPEGAVTKSLLEDGPRYFSQDGLIRLALVIQAMDDWHATTSGPVSSSEEPRNDPKAPLARI